MAGTGIIWLALLGPVIALLTHLSWNGITTAFSAPGAFDPLILSAESGAVTLGVLLLLGTPLAWALARGTLPFPRVWEAGVLATLLLPPLVVGLLLVFMVGPYTPIGHLLSGLHLSATDTFLALVIAQVYESAPYYVLGAQAAFSSVDHRLEQQAALLGDPPRRVFRRVTVPLAAPGMAMAHGDRLGPGDGSIRRRHHHRLPSNRAPAADLDHAAGDRPAVGLAVRPRPAGCRAAAADRGLHLERPCSKPTSRLTAATSRFGPAWRSRPGERLALFGPSGAGKTTLLEAIAGLVAPRRARITLAGRVLTSTDERVTALPAWRRRVGLLRQDPGLFPHLSVRDNLLYGRPGGDAVARAELVELTQVLGISGLLATMPARLSGGQAHRVALGRLLLSHCDALLLDEPYAGLDSSLRRTLTDLVVSLVTQRAVPSILVAHELAEAQAFADRLAVLDGGRILQEGAPDEVVLCPATRRVAELVGYTAFVPVRSARADSAGPTSPPAAIGFTAGIHPDRVIGGRHPDLGLILAGVVTSCRPAGALWEIAIMTGEVTVTVRLPEAVQVGLEIEVTATDPPRFGPDGTAAPVRPAPAAAGGLTAARAAQSRQTGNKK